MRAPLVTLVAPGALICRQGVPGGYVLRTVAGMSTPFPQLTPRREDAVTIRDEGLCFLGT